MDEFPKHAGNGEKFAVAGQFRHRVLYINRYFVFMTIVPRRPVYLTRAQMAARRSGFYFSVIRAIAPRDRSRFRPRNNSPDLK